MRRFSDTCFAPAERRVRQNDHELVTTVTTLEVAAAEFRLHPRADGREHRVAAEMTMPIVDVLEVVEIEHDEREREFGPSCPTNLRIEHFERVRAIETAGQPITDAVLADFAKQLRVLQRHGQQCRRRTQNAALMIGQWWLRGNAKHTFGVPATIIGKQMSPDKSSDERVGFTEARRAARSRSAGEDSPTAIIDSQ